MKRKNLLLIFLCGVSMKVHSQWNQLGPPAGPGGEITAIHRFNDTLYLGGDVPVPPGIGIYNGTNYYGLFGFHSGALLGFTQHLNELVNKLGLNKLGQS